jgi:hypothetical protein
VFPIFDLLRFSLKLNKVDLNFSSKDLFIPFCVDLMAFLTISTIASLSPKPRVNLKKITQATHLLL